MALDEKGLLGEAGNVKGLQVHALCPDLLNQGWTVNVRHLDISYQQRDGLDGQHLLGMPPIFGLKNLKTSPLQNLPTEEPDCRLSSATKIRTALDTCPPSRSLDHGIWL